MIAMMMITCPNDSHYAYGAMAIAAQIGILHTASHGLTDIDTSYSIDGDTFSERRNNLLMRVMNSHVLNGFSWLGYIDPDERVINPGQIRDELESLPKEYTAANIRILAPHTKIDGTVSIDEVHYCRFARPHSGLRFKGDIHESWVEMAAQDSSNIYSIKSGYIHHLGYDVPYQEIVEKAQRNREMYRKMMQDGKMDARSFYHMGKELLLTKEYKLAHDALVTAVGLGIPPKLEKQTKEWITRLQKTLAGGTA
jgi:hypothetical protein